MVDRETPVQKAVLQYLRLVFPLAVIHHARGEINKRGRNIAIELAKAKAKGSVKGFPDLIVLPDAATGPLFFEVKAEGNYADATQRELHAKLAELGYRVAVVRSATDAQERLQSWGLI